MSPQILSQTNLTMTPKCDQTILSDWISNLMIASLSSSSFSRDYRRTQGRQDCELHHGGERPQHRDQPGGAEDLPEAGGQGAHPHPQL